MLCCVMSCPALLCRVSAVSASVCVDDVVVSLLYSRRVADVDDVEREKPGLLAKIHEWYRDYKLPDGKPQNAFGFGGKYQNKVLEWSLFAFFECVRVPVCVCVCSCTPPYLLQAYALKVIAETHGFWKAKYGGGAAQKH